MGYPMDYRRLLERNGLHGGYGEARPMVAMDRVESVKGLIRGDLRRLEQDQRDALHLRKYARYAGVTAEQARKVLDGFFNGIPPPEARDQLEEQLRGQSDAALPTDLLGKPELGPSILRRRREPDEPA